MPLTERMQSLSILYCPFCSAYELHWFPYGHAPRFGLFSIRGAATTVYRWVFRIPLPRKTLICRHCKETVGWEGTDIYEGAVWEYTPEAYQRLTTGSH